MMGQIFSYLKKNIIVIALVFSLGAYSGYKILESAGMAALLANIPIPEGSIADKDAFIKNLPEGKTLEPKELVSVDKKAKNIILLIADGMSISQVSSYRLIKGGPNERLAVDKFPVSGIVLTHSVDAIVTDSASSATASSATDMGQIISYHPLTNKFLRDVRNSIDIGSDLPIVEFTATSFDVPEASIDPSGMIRMDLEGPYGIINKIKTFFSYKT